MTLLTKALKIDSMIVKTTYSQAENLDKQVARFVFSENIPFKSVEGEEFVKLCGLLRPGYKPPTCRKISGQLLDTIYEECENEVTARVEASTGLLILTQDGWSSCSNDPIIGHCFTDGKTSFLHSLIDSGSTINTAEYCFDLLDQAITEIETKYNKKVFGICTDNENKMKVRKLVNEKYPEIIVYGCSAHYECLLLKDIKREVFRLTDQMKVYGEALHKFQSDHCKLSDATHIWIGLLKNEVI